MNSYGVHSLTEGTLRSRRSLAMDTSIITLFETSWGA